MPRLSPRISDRPASHLPCRDPGGKVPRSPPLPFPPLATLYVAAGCPVQSDRTPLAPTASAPASPPEPGPSTSNLPDRAMRSHSAPTAPSSSPAPDTQHLTYSTHRSEERRVGKECRS